MSKAEQSDAQLLEKLYEYLDAHDITQEEAGKQLGVSRETVSKWKKNTGHELSIKNRKGIKALIFNANDLNCDIDPLNKMLQESWKSLNNEKKFKVLAYIEQLKTATGGGTDQLGEPRQLKIDSSRMGFKARLIPLELAIAR